MKLDRSKPYAQVIGAERARYHQNGKDFDADDNLIGDEPAAALVNRDLAEDERKYGRPQEEKRKPGRPKRTE